MKEIKHVVHTSHSHSYEIDVTQFADFIEQRDSFLILVLDSRGGYRSANSFDIATVIRDFQEVTLPKTTQETR